MTVILTNDDGIDAPGIRALLKAVNGSGILVAPSGHYSGCGHQVTTTAPIRVEKRTDQEYAIAGTPADCSRIALNYLFPDTKLVLSGINSGGNMGVDVYISGTVAAIREAAFHRVPGIAISQYKKGRIPVDWERSARWAARVVDQLANRPYEPGFYWNVNLPYVEPDDPEPEMVFCHPCTQPLPTDFRIEGDEFYYCGQYGARKRDRGSDVEICLSGKIAITYLSI
ncbi:5'/3'-nucleotidase SurE [Leptolyngbya sp. GGD]|uniref:5'/3'-nucleotidase SurE n=1 Tax=Leptolyngbya sp. GGD TaxID=2997907 RepID=UPI00227D555E|nr:5'/3'-nucleotidase SurE [Leptolyngbya sp. GGD]MCY6492721.1 5'/3'-nucleotidase SurE [Leptolyngbya sp. GGD]